MVQMVFSGTPHDDLRPPKTPFLRNGPPPFRILPEKIAPSVFSCLHDIILIKAIDHMGSLKHLMVMPNAAKQFLSKPLRIALPIGMLVIAFGVFGYLKATKPKVPAKPPQEKVWIVAAHKAVTQDAQPIFRLYGEVVAGREADLRPLVSGRIDRVGPSFKDGAVVRAGDLLVAIDPFDYEAAAQEREAELTEAEANLSELKAELEGEKGLLPVNKDQVRLADNSQKRRKKLLGKGAGTQAAHDDAISAYNERQQQFLTRKQTITRLEAKAAQTQARIDRLKVALSKAERDLEQTLLIAPFDGFLTETQGATGKQVSTSDRIARLTDASQLEARFFMSAAQFARLIEGGDFTGRDVAVNWRAGTKNFRFKAVLDRSEERIDPTSGGILLFATLQPQALDTVLRPGAFVEVEVPDRVHKNVYRLPASAVHNAETIYVIEDGRLAAKQIKISARDGNDVLLTGDLPTDTEIVTTRFPEMGPGVKVRTGLTAQSAEQQK